MSANANSAQDLQRAAALLRSGGLVAFPTETVYGLGAAAINATAVARIFEAKGRPRFDPLIVHLATSEWLAHYVVAVPPEAQRLAATFWPGPLTLVLPKQPIIPEIVTAGLPTVAVRVPAHPMARALIQTAGVPVAAPSANRFGHISPTTAEAVHEELGGRVDFILDGGATQHGIESTVVAFENNTPIILRPGPITRETIESLLGKPVKMAAAHLGGQASAPRPQSPGQFPRHYAPRTPLQIVANAADFPLPEGKRVGLLAFQDAAAGFAVVERLSPKGDLRQAAANLFSAMRRLDHAHLDLIVAEAVPENGLGLAIMDRLRKASF